MTDRLCIYCEHFNIFLGTRSYGAMTPGDPAAVECFEGHWELFPDDRERITMKDFRTSIKKAKDCEDFKDATPELGALLCT